MRLHYEMSQNLYQPPAILRVQSQEKVAITKPVLKQKRKQND